MAEQPANYYDILEVSPRASAEVLRAAYKSLMQRHHPDKHGTDSRMAQRASLIAQAYGVLSDSSQRAAYDAQLARQQAPRPPLSAAHAPSTTRRTAGPAPRSNWYLWLLATVIALCGAAMWALSGKKPITRPDASAAQPAASQPVAQKPETASPTTTDSSKASDSRAPSPLQIALLGSDLRIVLASSEPLPENVEASRHILTIPALTVDIGPADADKFASALTQHKETVLAKLADKLVYASYPELKIDGDKYLARFIQDALREITGTQGLDDKATPGAASTPANTEAPRYGIVAVTLPASFGLR
jgi:hypothetical protein